MDRLEWALPVGTVALVRSVTEFLLRQHVMTYRVGARPRGRGLCQVLRSASLSRRDRMVLAVAERLVQRRGVCLVVYAKPLARRVASPGEH
ncbi:hypothetical protein [Allokutzneria sp. NRRL B-24872]|uniref:hypothetical protein n=1 Tax=Allokutzneria sp. NRRL B-24872 TaxID=1137961 RepID=UPI001AEFD914|nr:hypothetical protein [Allokutzneria sp. NRRL B-24872]